MLTRRIMLASAALSLVFGGAASADDRLKVIASFSILGDMVQNVGGDRIALSTLVGPDGDGHVYQPSPADAEAVAQAGLLVINGLEFEGWTSRLIEAAGYAGPIVLASEGIDKRPNDETGHHDHTEHDDDDHDHAHDDHDGHHHHGTYDPHAWQSVPNAKIYIENIARGLSEADPEGTQIYAANAAAYLQKLDTLDTEIRHAVSALPQDRRVVVTSHDAFGYFGRDYGLKFVAPQGMSTDSEASARDVGAMINQIRDQGIKAVFVENISDSRLLEQITTETGARIGGTLFSDALSTTDGPASTYIDIMRHNITEISNALSN